MTNSKGGPGPYLLCHRAELGSWGALALPRWVLLALLSLGWTAGSLCHHLLPCEDTEGKDSATPLLAATQGCLLRTSDHENFDFPVWRCPGAQLSSETRRSLQAPACLCAAGPSLGGSSRTAAAGCLGPRPHIGPASAPSSVGLG